MSNSLTIAGVVDDPGYKGLPEPDIHLGNGAEIAVAGIRDGTSGGLPSLALSFKLPDGRVVLAETTWRLWTMVTEYFSERFGAAVLPGAAVEFDLTGAGAVTHLDIVADPRKRFVACELCGARKKADEMAGESDDERELAMLQWLRRHFHEKHPGWTPPTEGSA